MVLVGIAYHPPGRHVWDATALDRQRQHLNRETSSPGCPGPKPETRYPKSARYHLTAFSPPFAAAFSIASATATALMDSVPGVWHLALPRMQSRKCLA